MNMIYIVEFTYAPLVGEQDIRELAYVLGPVTELQIVPESVVDACQAKKAQIRAKLGENHPVAFRLVEKRKLLE